jgi:hypothetical protein
MRRRNFDVEAVHESVVIFANKCIVGVTNVVAIMQGDRGQQNGLALGIWPRSGDINARLECRLEPKRLSGVRFSCTMTTTC